MNNSKGFGNANIIKVIPVPSAEDFFSKWLEVIKPIHHLTDREMNLLAEFLRRRHMIETSIPESEKDKIDNYLMHPDVKREIRETCNLSAAYYQKIMTTYKERGIIIDDPDIRGGKINPRYIPVLKADDKLVGVLFILTDPHGSR